LFRKAPKSNTQTEKISAESCSALLMNPTWFVYFPAMSIGLPDYLNTAAVTLTMPVPEQIGKVPDHDRGLMREFLVSDKPTGVYFIHVYLVKRL